MTRKGFIAMLAGVLAVGALAQTKKTARECEPCREDTLIGCTTMATLDHQYTCSPEGKWVIDAFAEAARAKHENHRRQLFWALRTRALTAQELKEADEYGEWLNVESGISNSTYNRIELNEAWLQQARLRAVGMAQEPTTPPVGKIHLWKDEDGNRRAKTDDGQDHLRRNQREPHRITRGRIEKRGNMERADMLKALHSGLRMAIAFSQLQEHLIPPPDRGWELLNEHAELVPNGQRGEFIAISREFEGAFTSGYLTETGYVNSLNRIAKILATPCGFA